MAGRFRVEVKTFEGCSLRMNCIYNFIIFFLRLSACSAETFCCLPSDRGALGVDQVTVPICAEEMPGVSCIEGPVVMNILTMNENASANLRKDSVLADERVRRLAEGEGASILESKPASINFWTRHWG